MKQFLSPDGELVEVENLKQYCRERGLSYSAMTAVRSGRQRAHRGWRLPDGVAPACFPRVGRPGPTMRFTDPSGDQHCVDNLTAFCRDRGLDRSLMGLVWRGAFRQHKGWRRTDAAAG